MKNKFGSRYLASILIAVLALCIQSTAWSDDDHRRIFFFGDSLSDPGNVFAATGEVSTAPFMLIPERPYEIGGYHFSNGKTWAEHFARHLESKRSGKAALVKPGVFGNYAFGGARLRSDVPSLALSAASQVGLYLENHGTAYSDALYVLQFGGNDVRDALMALSTIEDPNEAQAAAIGIVGDAIAEEVALIQLLYGQGARDFLVANVPNIGLTPAVQLAGPEAVFFGGVLSAAFNDNLTLALGGLQALPGISITQLDIAGILNEVIASPRDFGIRNTTSACLMFFVPENAVCRKPGKYVFWDGIHPTAKVHRIVGRAAASLYGVEDND